MKGLRVEMVHLTNAGPNGSQLANGFTNGANKWLEEHPNYEVVSIQPVLAYGDVYMLVTYIPHQR
ncbi:MAG: hypothetical protein ACOY94_16055 [Bacillota bacterium]